jgi:hypothetical protein
MRKWIEEENGGVSMFDGRRQAKLFPVIPKVPKITSPSPEEKRKTGTNEWADATFNSQKGCVNNCKYGYCKLIMAPRFKLMPAAGWEHPEYRSTQWILKRIQSEKKLQQAKTIMYPSMHDISTDNLDLCIFTINALRELTKANLLLVSKPQRACIQKILDLNLPKSRIEFRFTIGCWKTSTWNFWEPSAPLMDDRIDCVKLCQNAGYKVSISMEPLLETDRIVIWEIVDFFANTLHVDSIWVGAMNYMSIDIAPQLDYGVIYAMLKNIPQVRWKESFRKHLSKTNEGN